MALANEFVANQFIPGNRPPASLQPDMKVFVKFQQNWTRNAKPQQLHNKDNKQHLVLVTVVAAFGGEHGRVSRPDLGINDVMVSRENMVEALQMPEMAKKYKVLVPRETPEALALKAFLEWQGKFDMYDANPSHLHITGGKLSPVLFEFYSRADRNNKVVAVGFLRIVEYFDSKAWLLC